MHDADHFLTSYHATQSSTPPVHKLSTIHCTQKKLSLSSFKRVNVHGAKPSIKGTVVGGAMPTHCLVESESYEGPNYFLSHINPTSPPLRNEHSTQTTSVLSSRDRLQSTPVHDQQLHLPRPSVLQSPNGNSNHINSCKSNESGHTPDADGMQRRQTLVNLETAKYRYLAAEMAHKRVLERSVDGAGESAKKQAKSKRKRGKGRKSPTAKKGPRKPSSSSSENVPSNPSPPLSLKILEPPTPPQPQPDREFEPSRLAPLLIGRNMVSTTDGGQLSMVPEEGAYELNVTPSPSFGVSSLSTGRDPIESHATGTCLSMKQAEDADTFTMGTDDHEATASSTAAHTEVDYTSSNSATSATDTTALSYDKVATTNEKEPLSSNPPPLL